LTQSRVRGLMKSTSTQQSNSTRTTNSKPIPHIPLPFKEVMADVLKVKPPEKETKGKPKHQKSK
jgi:hypothetical protein